nr:reverse transcriptase domain-containing protein [Tanacetum cinerariifolium]
HLDTIPATESDEFIKSCVENLVPNSSESEGKNGCDLPACFTTLLNILFDAEYEFDSVDDQSLSNEDGLEEIFSNPLFEEEINSMRINQHNFNAESDLIESLLNHDSSIIPSSSKIDSLLDEFAGELTLLKSIPSGIDETDYHPENEIRLSQRLFDYLIEEINLTFTPDDPMLPGIEEDDDDSRDILIREELLDNYSLPPPENESFHFDIPSFSRPSVKPSDGPFRPQVSVCKERFKGKIAPIGENRAFWSDKLDDAHWAFRIAYKTPIGCTPYKLVYRKACHLPIELEHKAY